MRFIFSIMVIAALSACTVDNSTPPIVDAPTQPTVPPANRDTCKAADMKSYVGKPSTALETKLLLQPVRIVPEGGMMTMDYLPDRINFFLNKDRVIQRITCG